MDRLTQINRTVTWFTLIVGGLLIVGLFSRLAAFAGALFLLSVMASQPPWVDGARLDYFPYQLVELFALLALAVIPAGRWAGLDFFTHWLCFQCCRSGRTES